MRPPQLFKVSSRRRLLLGGIAGAAATAAAAASTSAVTSVTTSDVESTNPNLRMMHLLDNFNFKAGIVVVIRSSRAIFTIASNVIDYEYSLHGLSKESDVYRDKLSEVHLRSAKRILKLCEANKGIYVKAGQFVVALQQAPKEYLSTLSSLQDQAVPCNFKAIKEVLMDNLGPDFSKMSALLFGCFCGNQIFVI